MIASPIYHINIDEQGIAYIAGTTMKVAHIVIDATTWGMTPQEIQANYPHLSLGQIHAALAYYHDHQSEMDALLDSWDEEYEAGRAEETEPLSRAMLNERLHPRQK